MNKRLISSVGILAALLFIGTASIPGTATAETVQVKSNNSAWATSYPHQYGTWKKTAESDEITDLLKKKPQLAVLWAGYGFAKDYNAPRGHFYALQSNQNTLRTGAPVDAKTGPMPTACWTCKSPDVPRLIQNDGELEFFTGKWAKYGVEIANSIGCADCHDSKTAELAVGRPSLQRGIESAGLDMKEVSETEMRSLVCAQCHVEYYFKKTEWTDAAGNEKVAKVVTLPWANGMTVEGMESYYDAIEFKDWTHKISKTPMLKAQHPGYEIFKSGMHAQNGVTCADCHMPDTKIEGEVITDHQIKSSLDQMMETCLNCHEETPEQFKEIVEVLKQTYCRSLGIEFTHIPIMAERKWLQDRMEGSRNKLELSREKKLATLKKLLQATKFETFIHRKFVGQKRFSLEGGESLIPLLDLFYF